VDSTSSKRSSLLPTDEVQGCNSAWPLDRARHPDRHPKGEKDRVNGLEKDYNRDLLIGRVKMKL